VSLTPERLWQVLDERHRGERNAVTQGALAHAFGTTARQIRHLTEVLVVEQQRPVASTCHPPFGIFVAETREEKERYLAQLDARMRQLYRRRRAFDRTPLSDLVRQGVFSFKEQGRADATPTK